MRLAFHLMWLLLGFGLCSCRPAAPRPSIRVEHDPAPVATSLRWTVPQGWTQLSGSGMRLATLQCENSLIECSVFAFPGTGGGVEANARRWAGQAGIPLSEVELADVLAGLAAGRTDAGCELTIVDFTDIGQGEDSLLGAIVGMKQQSVFLKMVGPRGALRAQRDAFVRLCRSIGEAGP